MPATTRHCGSEVTNFRHLTLARDSVYDNPNPLAQIQGDSKMINFFVGLLSIVLHLLVVSSLLSNPQIYSLRTLLIFVIETKHINIERV